MYKTDKEFSDRIITGDESWFHIMNQKVKSIETVERREEAVLIKVKAAPSAGRRMATLCWNREGILLLDWLPEKTHNQ